MEEPAKDQPAEASPEQKNGKSSDSDEGLKRPAEGDPVPARPVKALRLAATPSNIAINGRYQEVKFRKQFAEKWSRKEPIRGAGYELKNEPFQLGVLENFLREDADQVEVTRELEREFSEMEWRRKQMDLYEFYQTTDLCSVRKEFLAGFYRNLREKVMPLMQQLTGIKLTHVSASCSMYNAGDYLLVHDDLLTDRRIAFVYYLSPWEGHRVWTEAHGGALELFRADENLLPVFPVKDKVYPRNNQLVFFKVSEKSFHQVGEVTTFEYPRLTINGWFHGPIDPHHVPHSSIIIDTHYFAPVADEIQLSEWVNNVYLIDEVKLNIQKKVEMFSEVSLEEFLTPEIFTVMSNTLRKTPDVNWTIKGPAHLRKYEVLDFSSLKPGPLQDLYKLFTCDAMFRLLLEYTELDLSGPKAKTPTCAIELQRWQKSCYTVLGDPSSYSDCALDLLFFLNAQDNVGVVTYLVPEGDQRPSSNSAGDDDDDGDEDDPVLLTVYPKNNVLNVVYRAEGTTKFTKYVSRNVFLEQEQLQLKQQQEQRREEDKKEEGDEDDEDDQQKAGHPYTYILACSYKE
uniref:uS12 prolyl 3-hydroxylase n=1 Tax=Culex pipiens TaxID=7175 RepID=A0A8D8BH31_CULPI